jgi:hypothetical protein
VPQAPRYEEVGGTYLSIYLSTYLSTFQNTADQDSGAKKKNKKNVLKGKKAKRRNSVKQLRRGEEEELHVGSLVVPEDDEAEAETSPRESDDDSYVESTNPGEGAAREDNSDMSDSDAKSSSDVIDSSDEEAMFAEKANSDASSSDGEIFASFLLFYLFTFFTFFKKSKNLPALLKERRQPPRTARTPSLTRSGVRHAVRGSLEDGSDF